MLVFPGYSEASTRMGSMLSHQQQLRLLLSILVLLSPQLPVRSTSTDIVQRFHDPEVKRMNHLVVDKNTGRVYVGAVNRLYQLSPDLNLVVKEVTGPKGDSTACSMIDCPRETPTRLVDNVNKALVIDYTTTRLISCGSLSQGTCRVRNLHNISDMVQEVKEAVVANNVTASTVAFIAPGPPNPPVSQVMYVGVTYTGNSPYRSEVPAVSSRSLDKDRMLNIAETAVTTGTRMYVNSLSRERYRINYVYGFSSGGFSYFMTTQMRNTETAIYISKLVRVCQDDQHYYSYTEIPINCTNDGIYYNLVQAAYVGKAGSVLAGDLGITAQDDVLFAVFAEGNTTSSDIPKEHSALCVYSLKAIRRKFMTNIQKCFSGEGHRGLGYISPSHKCILTVSDSFCIFHRHDLFYDRVNASVEHALGIDVFQGARIVLRIVNRDIPVTIHFLLKGSSGLLFHDFSNETFCESRFENNRRV
ncbi:plxna4 [Anthophora retusa]